MEKFLKELSWNGTDFVLDYDPKKDISIAIG